ncbi:MAG: hypothetical protein A2W90_18005 [Bacteroidetes bacterium GWF2_42_66]|nr:MAG: hypothetical protein A2W92_22265 [Bacteroidetes bacterium GWA2_42_15]OFX98146.1 MAG: hypothetical protein A2W89_09495 [Bacteroidetes bacterium GWE2_42_39]OFY42531.1 MAG: hypothetical protein A2W90_18005 [Bacteroidetes bacterium GWF2_42_66]HBL74247.1 hypothetical protein [Prolixibacteraceae bacterium]HCU64016.1 hypothetical protein [Prolixibacteraceae bacterium]
MTYKPSILDQRPSIDTGYVSKLLSDVFGIESPVYVPWFLERTYKALPYTDVKEGTPANGLASPYTSVGVLSRDVKYDNAPVRFGQKTFGAFWFLGGVYKTWDYKGNLVDIELSDLLMPLATLVEFTRPKTVTKTPTLGGMGSVKEIYGMEDWNISISGIILPEELNPLTQQSVDEQMKTIQLFHETSECIDVQGQLFSERSITRIVTESLKFTPVQGKPNMMQYSIEAVSDGDIILTE